MGKPTQRQALIKAAREGQPVQRVEVPRTTCPRCGARQYASGDGMPRPHLRATVPGEALYSSEIPIMTDCEAQITAVSWEDLPGDMRAAYAYLAGRDALADAGASRE
jgi:hypothetical protein